MLKKVLFALLMITWVCLASLATYQTVKTLGLEKEKQTLEASRTSLEQKLQKKTFSNCSFEELIAKSNASENAGYTHKLVTRYVAENKDDYEYYIQLFSSYKQTEYICEANITELFNTIISKNIKTNVTSAILYEKEIIYGEFIYPVIVQANDGASTLYKLNIKTQELVKIFSTGRYTDITLLGQTESSKKDSELVIVFAVNPIGEACPGGENCASLIKRWETGICKENKLGLWEFNAQTGKVNRLTTISCK